DAGRPGLDDHRLAIERLGAVRDPGFGEDEAFRALGPERESLAGHVGPVADASDLAIGQVLGVVDVPHGVRVGEPDLDLDLVGERTDEVARISRGCRRGRGPVDGRSVRAGAGRDRAIAGSWPRPRRTTAPSRPLPGPDP